MAAFVKEEVLHLEAESIKDMMDKVKGLKNILLAAFPASPELLAEWVTPIKPEQGPELDIDFTAPHDLYWRDWSAVNQMSRLGKEQVLGLPMGELLRRFDPGTQPRVAQAIWCLKLLGCAPSARCVQPGVGCYTQPYSECSMATIFVSGDVKVSCLDHLRQVAPRVYSAITSGRYSYRQYVMYGRPQVDVREAEDR